MSESLTKKIKIIITIIKWLKQKKLIFKTKEMKNLLNDRYITKFI